MKKFLILFLSLTTFPVFAFECEMETFFHAEPCTPVTRPWNNNQMKCTKYSGGIAKVSGDLDNNGFGYITVNFKDTDYLLKCRSPHKNSRYLDCASVDPTVKFIFNSRDNGDSFYFIAKDGRFYSSDLNRCI